MANPRRTVALGLGSSLGPRLQTLALTVARLRATPGIEVERVSHWVRTPPLAGGTARNWFANGVALLSTSWDPLALLDLCIELEHAAGRRRGVFWGDRPLDLDVLVVDETVIDSERLVVPHPAVQDRPFVLHPLLEVWPEAVNGRAGIPYAAFPEPPGPHPIPVGLVARGRRLRYL